MTEKTYNQIGFNRLTKAQYDALVASNSVNQYDLYFITDEDTYALADQVYSKSEVDELLKNISLDNYYDKEEVDTKISNLVNSSPETLDTLKELADALGNDANFATTVTTELGKKANADDVYTKTEVDTELAKKQDTLTLKTINGESLVGSGDITVSTSSGGGASVTANYEYDKLPTVTTTIGTLTSNTTGYTGTFENNIYHFSSTLDDFGYAYNSLTFTASNGYTYYLKVAFGSSSDQFVRFIYSIDKAFLTPNWQKTATQMNAIDAIQYTSNLAGKTLYLPLGNLGNGSRIIYFGMVGDEDDNSDIIYDVSIVGSVANTDTTLPLETLGVDNSQYRITRLNPANYYVGNLSVSGASSNTCSPTFANINPDSSANRLLGSSNLLWKSVYSNNYYIGGTTYYLNSSTSKLNSLTLSSNFKLTNGLITYGSYSLQLPSKSGTLTTTIDVPKLNDRSGLNIVGITSSDVTNVRTNGFVKSYIGGKLVLSTDTNTEEDSSEDYYIKLTLDSKSMVSIAVSVYSESNDDDVYLYAPTSTVPDSTYYSGTTNVVKHITTTTTSTTLTDSYDIELDAGVWYIPATSYSEYNDKNYSSFVEIRYTAETELEYITLNGSAYVAPKVDAYTKTEIDAKIGDINTILASLVEVSE